MKGLFITRGVDQQFQLFVDPGTDPHELLRQMIEGVTVRVSDISSSWAKLHIQAPSAVNIIRPEAHSQKNWGECHAPTTASIAATLVSVLAA